jgi:hypothetical protein
LRLFLATIFAPDRAARIALFVATVLEAAAFGGVALRVVLSAVMR